jgi:hypothetical protein
MTIKGFTYFYAETGTEGGYWAVQDEKYITYTKGGHDLLPLYISQKVKDNTGRQGKIIKVPKSWHPVDIYDVTIEWDDGTTSIQKNIDTLACGWDYKGLHTLKTGNYLKIFEKDGTTVKWEGKIKLIDLGLFTDDAFGLWIHQDQEGITREDWAKMFLTEYPCELSNTGKVELR